MKDLVKDISDQIKKLSAFSNQRTAKRKILDSRLTHCGNDGKKG